MLCMLGMTVVHIIMPSPSLTDVRRRMRCQSADVSSTVVEGVSRLASRAATSEVTIELSQFSRSYKLLTNKKTSTTELQESDV